MLNPGRAMVAGDLRANENVSLTATQTLFAREHNRIVDALPDSLPDEERFQIARRVVGAEQQYITYEEFLPALGVELSDYEGYDPDVNASITNEFAVVGFRGHSMVHGEIEPRAPEGTYSEEELEAFEAQGIEVKHEDGAVVLVVPLNLAFGNPDLLERIGLGPVLKGIGGELQYKNDEQIDNQLRSVLFQVPRPSAPNPADCLDGPTLPDCFSGLTDLAALDIERGRDHGMPTYAELARAYGLAPKTDFIEITGERSDSFASDPEVDASRPIDDPDILDFMSLRDRTGDEVPLDSPTRRPWPSPACAAPRSRRGYGRYMAASTSSMPLSAWWPRSTSRTASSARSSARCGRSSSRICATATASSTAATTGSTTSPSATASRTSTRWARSSNSTPTRTSSETCSRSRRRRPLEALFGARAGHETFG